MHNRKVGRPGFTLTEVAVAAAILAVLASVVLASVHESIGTTAKRIGDSAAALRELTNALNKFDTATGNGTPWSGRMPLQIAHLTNPITSTASANCPLCRNSCGRISPPPAQSLYSATNVSGWNNHPGPFYSRDVTPGVGFALPIGLVRDTLIRTDATAANANRSWAILQIRIDNVSLADAQELDMMVDTENSAGRGTIRWTAAPNAEGMLSSIFWTIPVGGC
jgi:prepilin-type N-terminal cleavage/methylation domain-containing protein